MSRLTRKAEFWSGLNGTNVLDCSAPSAKDKIKVNALMNKMSQEAFSEYRKSCLPKEVTEFKLNDTVARLEKLFAKPQASS